MPYKIFYTDVPLPSSQTHPDFSKLVPVVRDTRHAAVDMAREFLARGAVVWRIEGPGDDIARKEVD